MIVCVCKAISEKTIRAHVATHGTSFVDLQIDLGIAVACGQCECMVREILAEGAAGQEIAATAKLGGLEGENT